MWLEFDTLQRMQIRMKSVLNIVILLSLVIVFLLMVLFFTHKHPFFIKRPSEVPKYQEFSNQPIPCIGKEWVNTTKEGVKKTCQIIDRESIPECYNRLEAEWKSMKRDNYRLVNEERQKIFNFLKKENIDYTSASDSLKFFFEKYHPDYKSRHWGSPGTPLSGPGSSLMYSIAPRCQLAMIIENYDIDLIIDISCGDFNWMNFFLKEYRENEILQKRNLKYLGSDIVEPLIKFHQQEYAKMYPEQIEFVYGGDISNDQFWPTMISGSNFFAESKNRLIICRHTLQHNFMKDAVRALENIQQKSNAQYLFMTNRVFIQNNDDSKRGDRDQRYFKYNYFLSPFYLPIPEMVFFENSLKLNIATERNIPNTLWKLPFDSSSPYKRGHWRT